jgi:UDP-3-O-[3-hydroxymyristoyl] glucosamine N-acyltransferase
VEEVKAYAARNAKIAADKIAAKLKAQHDAAQNTVAPQAIIVPKANITPRATIAPQVEVQSL